MCALLALAAATSGAQVPVFPAQTERVVVDVVVTDADGKPLAGLARGDFVVEDEGVPQAIEEFEAVDASAATVDSAPDLAPSVIATNQEHPSPGRSFVIVFDDLNLSPGSAAKARQALQGFLELQLRDSDCVTLAPTAGGAWWSGCLATDRADLAAALQALRGRRHAEVSRERMSDYEAMRIEVDRDRETMAHVAERFVAEGSSLTGGSTTNRSIQEHEAEVAATTPLARTYASSAYVRVKERLERTLRLVERGMRALAGGRGRRVVILASDGFVHDHRLPGFRRVREAARRSNAALYFVDAELEGAGIALSARPGLPEPGYAAIERRYAAEESVGAEALAADTGGLTIRGTDLLAGLARLTAESRVYYLLGYAPSNPGKEGRFRKIKVTVRRPGVRVRARSGYYPGPAPADDGEKGALPPLVRVALDGVDVARALSLRMRAHVLGNTATGHVAVALSAEADPAGVQFEPRDGRMTASLLSYSTVAARDSGELGSKDLVHDLALRPEALHEMATTWLPLTHVYELPPGRYQARLVAVDRASGRTGTVRQTLEVPNVGDLRLTTPVLTDMLAPGAGPDAAERPLPLARTTFQVGRRLICGVEVWGGRATPETSAVDIVYEVRRADGSVVARTDPKSLPREASGRRADQFKLTLHRAGEYELRLRARDRSSSEEVVASERFTVAAVPVAQ